MGRKNALRSKRGNAKLSRRKNARLFPELSAMKFPTDSVAASPSRNVQMFLSSNVYRFPKLTVRISIGNHALKFQSKIVNRSQDGLLIGSLFLTKEVSDRQ